MIAYVFTPIVGKLLTCEANSCHSNSHNYLNRVYIAAIKISLDLCINTPVPGSPQ